MDARLPSSQDQLWTATRFQLRFYVRSARFIAMAAVMAAIVLIEFVAILYAGTSSLTVPPNTSATFLSGVFGPVLFPLVGIVAGFFGGDATSMDTGTASGLYTLVLPVNRYILLWGRFLGAFLASVPVIAIFFLGEVGIAQYIYASIPGATGVSFLLILLLILALLGFSFLLSTLFRSPLLGILVTVLILLFALSIARQFIVVFAHIEPWFMINYGAEVTGLSLAGSYPHSLPGSFYQPYLWEGALIMFAYFIIGLVLSTFVFLRREVLG